MDGRTDPLLCASAVGARSPDVCLYLLARRRRQRESQTRRVPQRGNHLRLRTTATAPAERGLDGVRLDGGRGDERLLGGVRYQWRSQWSADRWQVAALAALSIVDRCIARDRP